MSIRIPTDRETLRFIAAVQVKTADVAAAYARSGKDLFRLATPAIKQATATISRLQKRHAAGDLTHTSDDEQALRDYSRWLVEAWHRLHGTEVPKTTWIRDEAR